MIEIPWQYNPATATQRLIPATADAALRELTAGNLEFAEILLSLQMARSRHIAQHLA